VKDQRPRNLDFSTLRLPLAAIASILHRISGVFIFAGVAVLLYLLGESLSSEAGFGQVAQWMDMLIVKLVVWAVLAGLLYHFIAGIKHLLMDMGYGETLAGSQLSAKLVIGLSAVAIILAGLWLW
jgi:succinate dehydrogenase / fumarate reductase cytochrome b subunit